MLPPVFFLSARGCHQPLPVGQSCHQPLPVGQSCHQPLPVGQSCHQPLSISQRVATSLFPLARGLPTVPVNYCRQMMPPASFNWPEVVISLFPLARTATSLFPLAGRLSSGLFHQLEGSHHSLSISQMLSQATFNWPEVVTSSLRQELPQPSFH
jgi:hypothetical protein